MKAFSQKFIIILSIFPLLVFLIGRVAYSVVNDPATNTYPQWFGDLYGSPWFIPMGLALLLFTGLGIAIGIGPDRLFKREEGWEQEAWKASRGVFITSLIPLLFGCSFLVYVAFYDCYPDWCQYLALSAFALPVVALFAFPIGRLTAEIAFQREPTPDAAYSGGMLGSVIWVLLIFLITVVHYFSTL